MILEYEVVNSVEAMTVILLQKKYRLFSIYGVAHENTIQSQRRRNMNRY
jgi:hypothetical protein